MPWLPAHDAALRSSVAAGKTFAEAVQQVNAACGTAFTRNAAIARAQRLGLQPAHPPGGRARHPQRNRRSPDGQPVARRPVPFLALRYYHCRCVLDQRGKDGLALFCGARRLDGSSYCPAHTRQFHYSWRSK